MKKRQIFIMTFVAALAITTLAATTASATLWLKQNASLMVAERTTTTDVEFFLIHKGGVFGNQKVKCNGILIGTIGPGAEDEIKLVENLAKTEQDLIDCTLTEGTLGTCTAGSKVVVHSTKLPWSAHLELIGTATWNHFPTITAYSVLCGNTFYECRGLVRARFSENKVGGALFLLLGNELITCSDGENLGSITGHIETLGFTVS